MPWPRPESGKRVSPCRNAASSAVESPHRSPYRAECSSINEPRKPRPASITLMTTTNRPSRFAQLYACAATQPLASACSMMFWHTSDRITEKGTTAVAG